MKLLWQVEKEFFEMQEKIEDLYDEELTLEEFLDYGFNYNTILNPYEEDTDKKDLKGLYVDDDYNYSIDLTDEMLHVLVELSSTYEDCDGYTCANIVLKNNEDWKYFEELVKECE